MELSQHLEKLHAFNAVVKAGSIRKAALQMGASQPGISRTIATLELALGCRLLIRGKQRIELTTQGSEVFEFSEKLARDVSVLENKLIHGELEIQSSFAIGTYDSIGIYFFPKFLAHIETVQKGLELHLHTASSKNLMAELKDGALDLIVTVNPEASRRIVNRELFRDWYGFFLNEDTEMDPNLPLIYVPSATDHGGQSVEEHLDGMSGLKSRRRIKCESFEAVKAFTSAGLGVGVLPLRVAAQLVHKRGLFACAPYPKAPGRFGEHVIAFSFSRHRDGDPAIEWFFREMGRFLSRS